MKKKEQITLHKNLPSGKANVPQIRNQNYHISSNRAIIQKNQEKQNNKILSQQKVNINKKRSNSKTSNKQSRQMTSSLGKNQKGKSKRKTQSVKGSKKSLKRVVSQDENSVTSARRKNIYTDGYKQNKQKHKKKTKKYSDRQSSSSANEANEQNSIAQSITESIKSQAQRLDVDNLVNEIQQHQFANLHKLKLHMLNFIFRNRIIRDQQYDRLYELMVRKFPEKEEIFKTILFEIVSSLDN